MKFEINLKIVAAAVIFAFAVFGFACQTQKPANSETSVTTGTKMSPPIASDGGTTPTEAYKKLYAAVKAGQPDAIKALMTEKTISFAQFASQRQNQSLDEVVKNGFTMTTFSDTLPEIRDERIKDNVGFVEVYNAKESRWEDLPFVKENGVWKFAVGDLFNGSIQPPSKGLAQIESEAANVNGKNLVPIQPKVDANYSSRKPVNPAAANANTNAVNK